MALLVLNLMQNGFYLLPYTVTEMRVAQIQYQFYDAIGKNWHFV